MCIIDNSVINTSHFLSDNRNSAGSIFRQWIERGQGMIAYSDASGDCRETLKNKIYKQKFTEYKRAGRVYTVSKPEYLEAKSKLEGKPSSNDIDLLSLALSGKVVVLYSDDGDFQDDFLDPNVLPSRVGGNRRKLYPHRSSTNSASDQRRFLARHKCSH